jgi:putative phosphoribosyl transferase
MKKLFRNRFQAGSLLARRLGAYARRPDVIVLALPRGGVPLGFAVARALEVPLDIISVRKLGLPGHPEYAIGAVAAEGACLLKTGEIAMFGVPAEAIEALIEHERLEIARREALYRAGRPVAQLQDKVVILVDDGIATGSTMQLAVRLARRAHAAKIIVAVPVAANDTCAELAPEVDALICLRTPQPLYSVGQWYDDFGQTSDEEVTRLLRMARREATRNPDGQTS